VIFAFFGPYSSCSNTTLEHLQEFLKPTLNLDFMARLDKKTTLQQLPISTINLSLSKKKINLSAMYPSGNVNVEGSTPMEA